MWINLKLSTKIKYRIVEEGYFDKNRAKTSILRFHIQRKIINRWIPYKEPYDDEIRYFKDMFEIKEYLEKLRADKPVSNYKINQIYEQ